MAKQKLRNTIIILGAALVGLIGVQLYWVQNAYDLRKTEFNQKVLEGLAKTATFIENENTCFELISKVKLNKHQGIYVMRQQWDSANRQWTSLQDSVNLFYLFMRDTSLESFKSLKFENPATAEIQIRFQFESVNGVLWRKQPADYSFEGITGKNFYEHLTGSDPVYEKIDTAQLDSVIHFNLASLPFNGNFSYGIINAKTKKLEYASAGANKKLLESSLLRVNLFSDTKFNKPYFLTVFYPDESEIVLGSLWIMLLTSAAIIILLVSTVLYFVRNMLRQKKLSEMKTDFINNMTHEFKTPVTNIALALETIGDDPLKLNGRLKPIFNIISEENNRIRENIERILQIAAVDREQLNLKLEILDLHMLIFKVVRTFEMQVNSLNGKIKCHLNAVNAFVKGDETHIINILYNLIDNALKYSDNSPDIVVETFNSKNGILLCVEDKGIGMSVTVQKRIFDKFYRAQNGNVHDVKGFGLGLSYVKSIVDAHRGNINVKSEPGTGSQFTVYLPFSA